MSIWNRLRGAMPRWPSKNSESAKADTGDHHLELARESLRELIDDPRVPESVREELEQEYRNVRQMLDKLENDEIHIAVYGRVSVGKSALLNALLGESRFSTSPLHGMTRQVTTGSWREYAAGNILMIDTPGINEVDGEAREQLAAEVAQRADIVLFVVDGDMTGTEFEALRQLKTLGMPLLVVLNKADRYSHEQLEQIRESLARHLEGLVGQSDIVTASAEPARQLVIRVDEEGRETETSRQPAADVESVRDRLWSILENEGKSLAAVNASLFAGRLSDEVAARILDAKRHLGSQLIRTYCLAKGIAVAINPVPVADLVAAAVVDVSMIIHLSRIYGLPINKGEARGLLKTIGAQMVLLMGTVWAVHVLSSALKLGTAGLSAVVTGSAQGALAYYSTWVVGQAAERYLAQGKSWGEGGPKLVVREILDSIDRDTLIADARKEIRKRLAS
ncbi:MAG: GTP-binding protein [Gammaproteobacteria bacterium]